MWQCYTQSYADKQAAKAKPYVVTAEDVEGQWVNRVQETQEQPTRENTQEPMDQTEEVQEKTEVAAEMQETSLNAAPELKVATQEIKTNSETEVDQDHGCAEENFEEDGKEEEAAAAVVGASEANPSTASAGEEGGTAALESDFRVVDHEAKPGLNYIPSLHQSTSDAANQ